MMTMQMTVAMMVSLLISFEQKKNSDLDDEFISNDMTDELFDFISSPAYGQASAASGMMARYAKNNPAKAVSQLCTAISKWTKDYLQ